MKGSSYPIQQYYRNYKSRRHATHVKEVQYVSRRLPTSTSLATNTLKLTVAPAIEEDTSPVSHQCK